MTLTIKYEYEQLKGYPFVATAYNDVGMLEVANSKNSFGEAKGELLVKLKSKIRKVPTIIPEPEEIEL